MQKISVKIAEQPVDSKRGLIMDKFVQSAASSLEDKTHKSEAIKHTPPDPILNLEEYERYQEILGTLAYNSELSIRRAVAQNPATPQDALMHLARDSELSIRRAVAQNPLAPQRALMHLARDSEFSVRRLVAENPLTPEAALDDLAMEPAICRAVSENPSASERARIRAADAAERSG